MIKNKKSQIDDWLPLLVAIFALLFIFLLFSLKKNLDADNLQVLANENLAPLRHQIELNNFLNKKMNENENIADLIALSFEKNDFSEFENIIKNNFNNLVYIELIFSNGDKTEIAPSDLQYYSYLAYSTDTNAYASARIPVLNQNYDKNYIEIKLY